MSQMSWKHKFRLHKIVGNKYFQVCYTFSELRRFQVDNLVISWIVLFQKVVSSKLTNKNYFLGGTTFQFGNISSLWSKSNNSSKLFFDN